MNIPFATDIFVRPLEPLFFGPPRTTRAGEDHGDASAFPPTPKTFQGLIRTQLLYRVEPALDLDSHSRHARAQCARLVGTGDRLPEGWQIKGPVAARIMRAEGTERLQPWAPTPRFLSRVPCPKPSNDKHSSQAEPSCEPVQRAAPPDEPFPSDPLFPEFVPSQQPAMDDRHPQPGTLRWLLGNPRVRDAVPLDGWLNAAGLYWALSAGRQHRHDLYPTNNSGFAWHQHAPGLLPPFVRHQLQPGIKLERPGPRASTRHNDERVGLAEDAMIYTNRAIRMDCASGFWGALSIDAHSKTPQDPGRIPEDVLQNGLGHTGRKSRLVAFESCPPLDPGWRALLDGEHLQHCDYAPGQCFWMYALTPVAMDEKHGLPLGGGVALRWPHDMPHAIAAAIKIKAIAAFNGAPRTLGGWDMAAGGSQWRANQSYAPAGSAWLIELAGGQPGQRRQALARLNNSHALGCPRDATFGFGHLLVGIGPKHTPAV